MGDESATSEGRRWDRGFFTRLPEGVLGLGTGPWVCATHKRNEVLVLVTGGEPQ